MQIFYQGRRENTWNKLEEFEEGKKLGGLRFLEIYVFYNAYVVTYISLNHFFRFAVHTVELVQNGVVLSRILNILAPFYTRVCRFAWPKSKMRPSPAFASQPPPLFRPSQLHYLHLHRLGPL